MAAEESPPPPPWQRIIKNGLRDTAALAVTAVLIGLWVINVTGYPSWINPSLSANQQTFLDLFVLASALSSGAILFGERLFDAMLGMARSMRGGQDP